MQLDENWVRMQAIRLDIPLIGFTTSEPLTECLLHLKKRLEENPEGIPFVRNKPEKRINFKATMPDARTVIAFGMPLPLFPQKSVAGHDRKGLVASIAAGEDYHVRVRKKGEALVASMTETFGAAKDRVFVDNSRLVDKATAWRAGLGFYGKNNLLINEQFGSAFNIGVILTSRRIPFEAVKPQASQCGDCRACLDACPTGALGQGFQLDYHKCLSNLTQQKKLTEKEAARLQRFVYGCDICQWVCPYNRRSLNRISTQTYYDLDALITMGDETFKSMFGHSALAWRGVETIRRNARILKKYDEHHNSWYNRPRGKFYSNQARGELFVMVRVRFAPSPTGYVHVGSLRTALYNYLFAKQHDGKFLLRLEDTDRTRYEEGSVENLLDALYTTNVIPDEGLMLEDGKPVQKGDFGPYIQSERLDIYQKYIQKLLDDGKAYYCFCTKKRLDDLREKQKAAGLTPRYDGHCRDLSKEEVQRRIDAGEPYVIRLKLPEDEDITFEDLVRGEITINTRELDDQVLIKADGFPTYHFAVVVDDHLMGITHVIRGEEWLPSTPKHVYLYQCFGWQQPQYVHLPNILNADHKKLSKRQGDVSVKDFLNKGYLPEALVNFLALLGWSPEGDQEIFSMDELVEAFDVSRINKSGAVFDREKLNWMNGQYIRNLDNEKLAADIAPYLVKDGIIAESDISARHDWLLKVAELLKERISYFAQAPEELKKDLDGDFEIDDSDEASEILSADTVPILVDALSEKMAAADTWTAESIQKDIIKAIQKEHKAEKIKGKSLYMPIRLIMTGVMHGPDLALIMDVLGKAECQSRLERFKQRKVK